MRERHRSTEKSLYLQEVTEHCNIAITTIAACSKLILNIQTTMIIYNLKQPAELIRLAVFDCILTSEGIAPFGCKLVLLTIWYIKDT